LEEPQFVRGAAEALEALELEWAEEVGGLEER
jgi:hypothetical protein